MNINIETFNAIILLDVLYGLEILSVALKEERKLRVCTTSAFGDEPKRKYSTRFIPECQSCTLNFWRENPRTRID
jgi:hypothetical protein